MLYPSIKELTQNNKYNRYQLVIATAKCARIITDAQMQEAESIERLHSKSDGDRSGVRGEVTDEKAVKTAINKLKTGEFSIIPPAAVK